jgi:hypothetical protein
MASHIGHGIQGSCWRVSVSGAEVAGNEPCASAVSLLIRFCLGLITFCLPNILIKMLVFSGQANN